MLEVGEGQRHNDGGADETGEAVAKDGNLHCALKLVARAPSIKFLQSIAEIIQHAAIAYEQQTGDGDEGVPVGVDPDSPHAHEHRGYEHAIQQPETKADKLRSHVQNGPGDQDRLLTDFIGERSRAASTIRCPATVTAIAGEWIRPDREIATRSAKACPAEVSYDGRAPAQAHTRRPSPEKGAQ